MTNYENVLRLNKEEMAWFLMNRVTCDECRCCVYHDWGIKYESCTKIPENDERPEGATCIRGHQEWLEKESDERDLQLFAGCTSSVVVTNYNALSDKERSRHNLVYKEIGGKKYAVGMTEVQDD